MGERCLRKAEVGGSNPLPSTSKCKKPGGHPGFIICRALDHWNIGPMSQCGLLIYCSTAPGLLR